MKRLTCIALMLCLILFLVVMPGIVSAEWSGSQTVTLEMTGEGLDYIVISTSILDYAISDNWYVTTALDVHPTKGADLEICTTAYIPFWRVLYTTVGVRRGIYKSDTPLTPYLSITYRF